LKEFGLSKKERIKSKKRFEQVYSEGRTLFSQNRALKATFYVEECKINPLVQVAFAVHKKSGNAVWRNRVKRLLRESFRLNKKVIVSESNLYKKCVYIVFAGNRINRKANRKLYLKDIEPEVKDLLNKITREIKNA